MAVRLFAQWRPRRPRSGGVRTLDHDNPVLYVCAYWRANKKQVGCSFSAERHGLEGAVRKALKKARKANPSLRTTTAETLASLSW